MNKTIIIFMALFLFASVVDAQSNRTVKFQELGLSFETPKGWSGGVEGDYYLLGHSTIPGLMILSENNSKTAQQLKTLALQGITEEGIQLFPKGEFKIKGNDRVEGFYEGIFDGNQVRVFAIGLINQMGNGMNIHIVSEKGKFTDAHIREAEKLAGSVKFFRKVESPNTQFWKQRIVGRQLKYLKTRGSSDYDGGYTGQSSTTIIKLFSDGTCSYYSNSSGSFDGSGGSGMAGAKNNGDGTYKIYSVENKTYLELDFGDKTIEYELSRSKENYTLLDGTRFAVLDINRP